MDLVLCMHRCMQMQEVDCAASGEIDGAWAGGNGCRAERHVQYGVFTLLSSPALLSFIRRCFFLSLVPAGELQVNNVGEDMKLLVLMYPYYGMVWYGY